MVATVGSGTAEADRMNGVPDDSLCILWEPSYPHLFSEKFIVTPKSIQRESEQDEATVNVDMVENLLPFEIDPYHIDNETDTTANISMWKERGDQLLRLGDASAATSYYEKALFDSSSVSIGGTVVISVEGFPRIAEVDCIDDDDGTIDVTLVHNGDEKAVKQSTILLGILEDDSTFLQERILLNLARCMLQLSDLDVANRPKYLKSAVLATTLVITISMFRRHDEQGGAVDKSSLLLPKNEQSALMLRCKAYIGSSKWSRATSDAKKLVKGGSNEEQGRKLLVSIERKKKLQSKMDKKLAKDICRLVQSATAVNESESNDSSRTSVSPKLNSSRDVMGQRRNALLSSTAEDDKLKVSIGEECKRDATSVPHQQEAFTNSRLSSIPFSVNHIFAAFTTVLISILIANGYGYSNYFTETT